METGESSKQIFGLKELYSPGPDAEVDIIAVHGISGDALKTWTSDERRVCWLNDPDLLPKYMPKARVLTWGYNAHIWSVSGGSKERVMQHAQTMVAGVVADRELEGASERPIVWLCHSLGGIIVKRALAYSKSRTAAKIAHLHSIYTCTYGILFFGTPHNGSSKAQLLSSLQKMSSATIPKKALETNPNLVRALEQDSEVLQNITDHFTPLMSQYHIFFFWEQERTDLKYTRDYIVEETSAAPLLDDTERSGIAADHRNMCKFESKSSPGFITVVEALRRYGRDAPKVIQGRSKRAKEMLKNQDWLRATELVLGSLEPMPAHPAAKPELFLHGSQKEFGYDDLARGTREVDKEIN